MYIYIYICIYTHRLVDYIHAYRLIGLYVYTCIPIDANLLRAQSCRRGEC